MVPNPAKAALNYTALPGLIQSLLVSEREVPSRQVILHVDEEGIKLIDNHMAGKSTHYITRRRRRRDKPIRIQHGLLIRQ
ncbi:hypothetical protein M5E88_10705 [Akkermansia muciniphila]|nr:hypothetical protein M5E88_10705 [Akkermansia muciniphila]